MTYSTDGLIGANFAVTHTTPQFAVGTRTVADSGTVWLYVKASIAIAQYDFCTMDSWFNANPLMGARVAQGEAIGCAQIAFAADDYGWVAVQGAGLIGNVTASAMPLLGVYASATTGRITTSSTGLYKMDGVNILTTAGLTATGVGIRLNNPHANLAAG
jgi:hypothetical protein